MRIEPHYQPFSPSPKMPTVSATQGSPVAPAKNAHSLFNVKPQLSQDQKLEKQVRTWVGQTFFGSMLKQMRDSPFKSELFDGGRGGEAFQQMYDQRLAQHMANGVGTRIVRPLFNKMSKTSVMDAYGKIKKKSELMKEKSHVGSDWRA